MRGINPDWLSLRGILVMLNDHYLALYTGIQVVRARRALGPEALFATAGLELLQKVLLLLAEFGWRVYHNGDDV